MYEVGLDMKQTKDYLLKYLKETVEDSISKRTIIRKRIIIFDTHSIMSTDSLMQNIMQHCIFSSPIYHWNYKGYLFIRFANINDLNKLLCTLASGNVPIENINNMIMRRRDGSLMTVIRKLVRIEMPYVHSSIQLEQIKSAVGRVLSTSKSGFSNITNSEQKPNLEYRAVSFYVESRSLVNLLMQNDAAIVINHRRISIRIDLRPYRCRQCFSLTSNHICKGRACGYCGEYGHNHTSCKSSESFCRNCNSASHGSRDKLCTTYINQIIKLIYHIDLPVCFLKNEFHLNTLIKYSLI